MIFLHCYEKIVDISQNEIVRMALIIMLQAHANHIQKNTYHNKYVKFLIGRKIKEKSCQRKLKRRKRLYDNILIRLLERFTLGLGRALVGFLLPIFFIAL